MLGTWTWYANWSTGLLASSPQCPPELSLVRSEPVEGRCLTLPIARKEPAQAGAKLVPPGLP
jgi:hypothetical protein